jgi:hypothetical protein
VRDWSYGVDFSCMVRSNVPRKRLQNLPCVGSS